jgi:hypothetical protein
MRNFYRMAGAPRRQTLRTKALSHADRRYFKPNRTSRMTARTLSFPVYDADNHIYEPEDAFLRHLPKKFERDFYFVEKQGRKKLVINGVLSEFIPNPTFEVVSRPGGWEKFFRADNPESMSRKELAGRPIRPPQEWRTGDGRIEVLEQQGVHAALVFPTLASVIEERLGHQSATVCALFHSLNQWIDEEWGFARKDRLFSAPFISLTDVDKAVEELEFVLAKGARSVAFRPAIPSSTPSGRAAPTPASSSACTAPTAATTGSPSGGSAGRTPNTGRSRTTPSAARST